MRTVTVLIDIDDTMIDLLPPWVEMLNREYGLNVDPEDVCSWNMLDTFDTLTTDQVMAPLGTDELWLAVKPKLGAIHYVKQMIYEGMKIVAVTAASVQEITPKMKYVIERYFPFLAFDDVVITAQKDLIRGSVMIDDRPENLLSTNCYCRILMDAPHNRTFNNAKYGITRVRNWQEVYIAVHGFVERTGQK